MKSIKDAHEELMHIDHLINAGVLTQQDVDKLKKALRREVLGSYLGVHTEL